MGVVYPKSIKIIPPPPSCILKLLRFLFIKYLYCRFDDIWEPSEKDNPTFDYDKDPVKIDITKEDVPPALLMKVRNSNFKKIKQ